MILNIPKPPRLDEFGIRAELMRRGLTHKRLAEMTGTDAKYFSLALKRPHSKINAYIAEILGFKIHELWPYWFDTNGELIPAKYRAQINRELAKIASHESGGKTGVPVAPIIGRPSMGRARPGARATAVWLVENTTLTFRQIADFCHLHELEVKGIADGDVAMGIKGLDPVTGGQLARDEVAKGEANINYRLQMLVSKVKNVQLKKATSGPRLGERPKGNGNPVAA